MKTILQSCNSLNDEVTSNYKHQFGAVPTSEVSRTEQTKHCHGMHVEVSGKRGYAFI